MKISDADYQALLDACLDDGMRFRDIVQEFRMESGDSLLMACDLVMYHLHKSIHPYARVMYEHVPTFMSRYRRG